MKTKGNDALVFLHLSDIHFVRDVRSGVYDPDKDVRNELIIDAKKSLRGIGIPNGIIISGDIAYSGKEEEYNNARKWLADLCNAVNCPHDSILVTPGNHDVDWNVLDNTYLIRHFQQYLRNCTQEIIDDEIINIVSDDKTCTVFYDPIQTYISTFAEFFNCGITPKNPYWERDFSLPNDITLRFRGINSTLISNSEDNDAENKLIVGNYQATTSKNFGVIYSIVCHHPPAYLRDRDAVVDIWNQRVALQLFGHKHRQRIQMVDNSVIINSGAMHPARSEMKWRPHYIIIKLWVEIIHYKPSLIVQIYPRVWRDASLEFVQDYCSDEKNFFQYTFPLNSWFDPSETYDQKISLLIADDLNAYREDLSSALYSHERYNILGEAGTISEIFLMLDNLVPDVVLLDLKWFNDPTAGATAIHEIKRIRPQIKIIVITAFEELIEDAINAGADDALTKIFTIKDLMKMIDEVVER